MTSHMTNVGKLRAKVLISTVLSKTITVKSCLTQFACEGIIIGEKLVLKMKMLKMSDC